MVPDSFDDLGTSIEGVFKTLVQDGTIVPAKEVAPPPVPMDYAWARVSRLDHKNYLLSFYVIKLIDIKFANLQLYSINRKLD